MQRQSFDIDFSDIPILPEVPQEEEEEEEEEEEDQPWPRSDGTLAPSRPQQFGREWSRAVFRAEEILEQDPDYRFLVLVAGVCNTGVESLYKSESAETMVRQANRVLQRGIRGRDALRTNWTPYLNIRQFLDAFHAQQESKNYQPLRNHLSTSLRMANSARVDFLSKVLHSYVQAATVNGRLPNVTKVSGEVIDETNFYKSVGNLSESLLWIWEHPTTTTTSDDEISFINSNTSEAFEFVDMLKTPEKYKQYTLNQSRDVRELVHRLITYVSSTPERRIPLRPSLFTRYMFMVFYYSWIIAKSIPKQRGFLRIEEDPSSTEVPNIIIAPPLEEGETEEGSSGGGGGGESVYDINRYAKMYPMQIWFEWAFQVLKTWSTSIKSESSRLRESEPSTEASSSETLVPLEDILEKEDEENDTALQSLSSSPFFHFLVLLAGYKWNKRMETSMSTNRKLIMQSYNTSIKQAERRNFRLLVWLTQQSEKWQNKLQDAQVDGTPAKVVSSMKQLAEEISLMTMSSEEMNQYFETLGVQNYEGGEAEGISLGTDDETTTTTTTTTLNPINIFEDNLDEKMEESLTIIDDQLRRLEDRAQKMRRYLDRILREGLLPIAPEVEGPLSLLRAAGEEPTQRAVAASWALNPRFTKHVTITAPVVAAINNAFDEIQLHLPKLIPKNVDVEQVLRAFKTTPIFAQEFANLVGDFLRVASIQFPRQYQSKNARKEAMFERVSHIVSLSFWIWSSLHGKPVRTTKKGASTNRSSYLGGGFISGRGGYVGPRISPTPSPKPLHIIPGSEEDKRWKHENRPKSHEFFRRKRQREEAKQEVFITVPENFATSSSALRVNNSNNNTIHNNLPLIESNEYYNEIYPPRKRQREVNRKNILLAKQEIAWEKKAKQLKALDKAMTAMMNWSEESIRQSVFNHFV